MFEFPVISPAASPRVSRSKRRALPLAVALVGLPAVLSGCAPIVDFFGPRPDPVLLSLAVHAEDTGKSEQAAKLYQEISRVCGRDESGQVPHSCLVTEETKQSVRTQLATQPAPELLSAGVSTETKPLIVDLAVADLAAKGVPELPPLPTSLAGAAAPADATSAPASANPDADGDALSPRLASWFFGLAYGLDVARAFAEPADFARIDSLIQEYSDLGVALGGQPTAFYDLSNPPAPTDAASARAYVEASQKATRDMLTSEAVALPAGEQQDWLVHAAAWAQTH